MKKFYLIAASLMLAGTAMAQSDGYWYISGAFNDYNPDGKFSWALMDDDEGKYEGFIWGDNVAAGEFSFNLIDPEGNIWVPLDEDGATRETLDFSDSHTFTGTMTRATDDYEEECYWVDQNWEGGWVSVTVSNTEDNNPTIQIDVTPSTTGGDNTDVLKYSSFDYDNDQIRILWDDVINISILSVEGACIEYGVNSIPLTQRRYVSATGEYEGNIQVYDADDEIGIDIYLEDLNLEPGDYFVIIPQGCLEIDWEYTNAAISKYFEITETVEESPYMYIRSTANNFNPNGNEKWALFDDDEQENASFFTNTFDVTTDPFQFNLLGVNGTTIFVPMNVAEYIGMNETVVFTDNMFEGSMIDAYDETEENMYWTVNGLEGGQITVSVDANTGIIEIYAFPKVVNYNDNYTVTYDADSQVIEIYWEGNDLYTWHNAGEAYIEAADGTQIDLIRAVSGREGQVTVMDENPCGLYIDLTSLELEAGKYTLVIPSEYLDIEVDDFAETTYNPTINYEFTIAASGSDVPEVVPYWYISGAFNNYDPDNEDEWALMDDDEGEANVYTGTFTVEPGEFSFNLINSAGDVVVPMDSYLNPTAVSVTFVNNTYEGSARVATTKEEAALYWSDTTWAGGQITVSVDANGEFPTVTIYAFPVSNDYDSNYTITEANGEISIYWADADDIWYEEGGAYVVNSNGDEIDLVKNVSGQVGQVTLVDTDPYGLVINVTSLELPSGEYTLVIPAKYVQVVSNDYEDFLYNPEITYNFTVVGGTVGIGSLNADDANVSIYTLQGVKVNNTISNLSNGLYIINGKKVMIRK